MQQQQTINNGAKDTKKWRAYWPLITLITISLLAAIAINYAAGLDFMAGMHFFMGFFLCCFAMFKIFDIHGFADGFQRYDLLAKRSRAYALLYPFIELFLGLAYLAMIAPLVVYSLTIMLMGFGAVGVIIALKKGLSMTCPCMGSVLKVPLSTVTLTEDIAMFAMAVIMLLSVI